jgi:small subunit ribosomal protein S16
MLSIRLQRTGRINDPSYRVVVINRTEGPKSNKYVERLGAFKPKMKQFDIDTERVKYWLSVGAQPTPTVHNKLVDLKIISGQKIISYPKKSDKPAEAPKAAAPAPAETPVETPAEDAAPVTE